MAADIWPGEWLPFAAPGCLRVDPDAGIDRAAGRTAQVELGLILAKGCVRIVDTTQGGSGRHFATVFADQATRDVVIVGALAADQVNDRSFAKPMHALLA